MALAQARPEDRDATLLRAATALFCQESLHERDAIRRFEQLAIHLMAKVGEPDRAYVAALLAGRHDAPASVIRALARDAIGVAASVLRQSPVLTTIDLLGVIASTGPDHHSIIAGRPDNTADVTRALEIARSGQNSRTETSAPGESKANADGVGVPVRSPWHGSEETEPEETFTAPTIDFANFLDTDPEARLRLLGEAAERQAHTPRRHSATGRRLDVLVKERFAAADLVRAAMRGDREALRSGFAAALGIGADLVARFIDDPSGEPLALMARAAGLNDPDGRTILLLANTRIGESVDAFFRISDLYASLERRTAEAFIDTWRTSPSRPAGHVAVFATPVRNARTERPETVRTPAQRKDKKAAG